MRLYPWPHMVFSLQEIYISGSADNPTAVIGALFSTCVLYVLCEPRYNLPGEPARTKAKRQPLGSTIPFLYSVGYDIPTPSNSWVYWQSQLHDHNNSMDDYYQSGCNYLQIGCSTIYCPWGSLDDCRDSGECRDEGTVHDEGTLYGYLVNCNGGAFSGEVTNEYL